LNSRTTEGIQLQVSNLLTGDIDVENHKFLSICIVIGSILIAASIVFWGLNNRYKLTDGKVFDNFKGEFVTQGDSPYLKAADSLETIHMIDINKFTSLDTSATGINVYVPYPKSYENTYSVFLRNNFSDYIIRYIKFEIIFSNDDGAYYKQEYVIGESEEDPFYLYPLLSYEILFPLVDRQFFPAKAWYYTAVISDLRGEAVSQ
jgi:hypothetical protein